MNVVAFLINALVECRCSGGLEEQRVHKSKALSCVKTPSFAQFQRPALSKMQIYFIVTPEEHFVLCVEVL